MDIENRQLKACKEALDRCKKIQAANTKIPNHEACVQALARLRIDLDGIFETEF